jgi:hypothetical protein
MLSSPQPSGKPWRMHFSACLGWPIVADTNWYHWWLLDTGFLQNLLTGVHALLHWGFESAML